MSEKLSDTQKQNLSAIAKSISRDSKGRLLPTPTAQESRIEELEKQLTEEKRLHRLSKMSDANARGILQQIRDYLGGDSDESALAKVERVYRECIDRGAAYESSIQLSKDACRMRNEAEAALASARREIGSLNRELTAAGEEMQAVLNAAQEQRDMARIHAWIIGIVAVAAMGVAMYLIGRWAR